MLTSSPEKFLDTIDVRKCGDDPSERRPSITHTAQSPVSAPSVGPTENLRAKLLDEVSTFHTPNCAYRLNAAQSAKMTSLAHSIVSLTFATPQHFKSSLVASW